MRAITLSLRVLIFLVLTCATTTGKATTQSVSGDITGPTTTTWNTDTVLVTGDITITSTGKLIINPRTKVLFQGYFKILVFGNIKALGAEGDTIIFKRPETDTANFYRSNITDGSWGGITINTSTASNDSIVFRFCKFNYIKIMYFGNTPLGIDFQTGYKMIMARSVYQMNHGSVSANSETSLYIDSCNFDRNFYYIKLPTSCDIYGKGAMLNVKNSNFNTCSAYSILLSQSSANIRKNTITKISSSIIDAYTISAIHVITNSNANISHNIISFIGGYVFDNGIYVNEAFATIDTNTIIGTITNGVQFSTCSGYLRGNDISKCSFGVKSTGSTIYSANNYIHNNSNGYQIMTLSIFNINNDLIKSNSSKGIWLSQSDATLTNCRIVMQTLGGIYCDKAKLNAYNCLIANNKGTMGSAIESGFSQVKLINSIVANNKDNSSDYGCLLFTSTSGFIANSIIWGNVSNVTTRQVCILSSDIQPALYYSIVDGDSSAFKLGIGIKFHNTYENCSSDTPHFKSPTSGAGNGYDPTTADWALKSGSTCINNGKTDYNPTTTDLAGKSRVLNGIIDIGAFENRVPKDTNRLTSIIKEVRWMADTVVVNNNINIYKEGKLIIDPHVVVLFTGGYRIISTGTIQAIGTSADSIRFTRSSPSGVWSGICIWQDSTESDSTIFEHCIFEYIEPSYFTGMPYTYSVLYINLRNKIRLSNSTFKNITGNYSYGFFMFINSKVIFNNNTLTNFTGNNFLIMADGCDLKFNNNIIFDNTYTNYYSYLTFKNSKLDFSNNLIYNNSSNQSLILSDATKGNFSNNLIFNNSFTYMKLGLLSNNFSNNIIAYNNNSEIYLMSFRNTIVENNIFLGNNTDSLHFTASDTSKFRNNFISANAVIENVTLENCISGDPMFISPTTTVGYDANAGSANWRTSIFSPCIDGGYGKTINNTLYDIDGNSRVHGNKIDIGAYEHQGGLPEITAQPLGSLICEGSKYVFRVAVKETAIFQWQKDGVNIAGATVDSLVLNPVTITDQGSYTCKVSNSFGTVTSNGAMLNIKSKPKVLSTPESRFITYGSPLNIDVPVSGTEPINYSWYTNNSINNLYTSSSLSFVVFDFSTVGSYKLLANNGCGSDSTNLFALQVLPTTTIQNNDTLVCEGDSVVLRTRASAAATRQWRKNGIDLPAATGEYLLFDSITTDNTGTYSCMLSTQYGNLETSPILITVKEKPVVTSYLGSALVDENTSLTPYITASGTKPFIYKWMKSGTLITNSNYSKFNVPSFNLTNEGVYKAFAINVCGIDSTGSAGYYIAPKISIKNNDTLFCEGEKIVLQEQDNYPAIYQWYKDGIIIYGATKDSLVIASASLNDAGSFYCLVTSTYGIKTTNSKTINITEAPEIAVQPSSQWANIGLPFELVISVTGTKPLNYQWFKNTVSQIGYEDAQYSKASFSTSDSGKYYCHINNACGFINTVNAYVYPTPNISLNPKNNLPCEGTNLTLSASSGSGSTYQWYKDGASIVGAASETYVLNNIEQSNAGNYSCTVTKSGQSKSTETRNISIKTAPGIIVQPQSQWIYNNSEFKLNIVADGSKPLQYTWKLDTITIKDTLPNIEFDNFAQVDEGNYICAVSNVCGSISSLAASLRVAPELTNNSGSSVCENDTFELGVAFNDSAKYQWYKEGKQIPGAIDKTFSILNTKFSNIGNYQCRVSNANGYAILGPVQLTLRKSPSVEMLDSTTYVNATLSVSIEATAAGDEPLEYLWFKNDSALSGNILSSFIINGVTMGDESNYKCRVKNNCGEAETNETKLVIAPQLCMVTNDFETDSNSNLLVWDRNSSYKYHHFNVYRESYIRDKYDKIGEVPYKELTTFIDTLVNPKSQAYMYKITAVDSVNKETDINFTVPHKTIHLLVTQGIPEGIQLDWDEYIGFDYSTYSIFRSVDNAAFEKIDSMASTSRTWTDFSAPVTKDLKYFVSVKREGACYANTQKKAGAGPFVSAYSNMEDNSRIKWTADAINNIHIKGFDVYPNPFAGIVKVSYKLDQLSNVSIYLVDLSGREVERLVNSNQLAGYYKFELGENVYPGVYFLKVNINKESDVIRLVKVE